MMAMERRSKLHDGSVGTGGICRSGEVRRCWQRSQGYRWSEDGDAAGGMKMVVPVTLVKLNIDIHLLQAPMIPSFTFQDPYAHQYKVQYGGHMQYGSGNGIINGQQ